MRENVDKHLSAFEVDDDEDDELLQVMSDNDDEQDEIVYEGSLPDENENEKQEEKKSENEKRGQASNTSLPVVTRHFNLDLSAGQFTIHGEPLFIIEGICRRP